MVFANVVFHKKLPHRGDEEGSPISGQQVRYCQLSSPKNKQRKKKKITLRNCKRREPCKLLDITKVSELPLLGVKPL